MKKTYFLLAALCFSVIIVAQSNVPPVDKSPLDISYCPANYPVLKIQDKITDPLAARVIYSRPQKAGRPIFGGLVKYGELWRLGANEATEIEFFKNVHLGKKKINKGRYTLYAIASEATWTIIVNKETDTWGSFKYDAKKDVTRVVVTAQKTDTVVESMSMYFEKTTGGYNLIIAWDNIKTAVPFTF